MDIYKIVMVLIAVAISALLFMRLAKFSKEEKNRIKEGKKPLMDKREQLLIFAGVGLAVLIVITVIVYYEATGKGSELRSDGNNNIAIYLPVWIAIMVPFITRKRKKETSPRDEKLLILALVGTVLLVLGTVLYIVVK